MWPCLELPRVPLERSAFKFSMCKSNLYLSYARVIESVFSTAALEKLNLKVNVFLSKLRQSQQWLDFIIFCNMIQTTLCSRISMYIPRISQSLPIQINLIE